MLRRFRLEEPESVAKFPSCLAGSVKRQDLCRRHGIAVGDERRLGSVRAADQHQKARTQPN